MTKQFVSDLKDLGIGLLANFVPLIVLAIPVGLLYLGLLLGSCDSQIIDTITNLSGLDFEITDLECDTLPKDASINIFVSKTGTNEKKLIFKYDPFFDDVTQRYIMPSIMVKDKNIVISIAKMYSIYSKEEHWHDYVIDYRINDIMYP